MVSTDWAMRRNIRIHTELGRTKERRDKEEGERRRASGTSLRLGVRELMHRGEISASMAIHWNGGSHLKLLGSELTNL